MSTILDDPFAGSDSKPTLKFPDVGTSHTGTITARDWPVQGQDFDDPSKPATWDDGSPKHHLVLTLDINGEEYAVWALKPSAMFTALKDADAKAKAATGKGIEIGGTIRITHHDTTPAKNSRHAPRKLYTVDYKAPAPVDPFAATTTAVGAPPF